MLNTPIPESLMNLEECVFNGGVFGNKENSDAVRQRKYRGISYYFHRVFMSRKLLELEYPELKSKPHYLPFFQIRRWMRLLSSQKRKQVSNEIKSINSMNRETVDSFDRLLSSLGL